MRAKIPCLDPMNVFKTIFARAKPSEEARLLASLQRLRKALEPHDAHWAEALAAVQAEAAAAFANGSPVLRRYQLARKIEGLFGGMGSLNDIALPEDTEALHRELFAAVAALLRRYWRDLGRITHDAEFALFPVGAPVRLVPGKVRYYHRDESPVIVADTPAGRGQTWRVVRHEGPDITNMPSYQLQSGDTFMSARHESLEAARE